MSPTFRILYAISPARHHSPYRQLHGVGDLAKLCGKVHLERVTIVYYYSMASRCIPVGADFPL
jgi:hypothetical protein